jgi:hypothetical protein
LTFHNQFTGKIPRHTSITKKIIFLLIYFCVLFDSTFAFYFQWSLRKDLVFTHNITKLSHVNCNSTLRPPSGATGLVQFVRISHRCVRQWIPKQTYRTNYCRDINFTDVPEIIRIMEQLTSDIAPVAGTIFARRVELCMIHILWWEEWIARRVIKCLIS